MENIESKSSQHPLSISTLRDDDEMIDITPGNSPSENFKDSPSTFNNYHQNKAAGDSQSTEDMDRTHIPTHNVFGNDDFTDPEGENYSCLPYYHVNHVYSNMICQHIIAFK